MSYYQISKLVHKLNGELLLQILCVVNTLKLPIKKTKINEIRKKCCGVQC